jgi:hypothetical protein
LPLWVVVRSNDLESKRLAKTRQPRVQRPLAITIKELEQQAFDDREEHLAEERATVHV